MDNLKEQKILKEDGNDFIEFIPDGTHITNTVMHEAVGKLGDTISFTCEETNTFDIAIWRKAGSTIRGGTKYLIQQDGKTSCLTIKKLEKSDEDVYTCELRSKTRATIEKYVLKVIGDDDGDEKGDGKSVLNPLLAGAVGAVVGIGAIVATPLVLGAIGFTATGITGGSIAASMMSSAAVANGGGVAAGSLVATLQSIGATGALAGTTQAGIVGTTTSIGAWIGSKLGGGKKEDKKE